MAEYVNNKDFLEAIKKYKSECKEVVEKNEKLPPDKQIQAPQLTYYLGECIMLIAEGLGKRPNFINYAYKDDMIGEAIRDCVKAVGNFNPDIGSNPFAYFTQICWYAFIRIIEKEKKQDKIKYAMIKDANAGGAYTSWLKLHGRLDSHADETDLAKHHNLTEDDVTEIEESQKKKTRKKRTKKTDKKSLVDDGEKNE